MYDVMLHFQNSGEAKTVRFIEYAAVVIVAKHVDNIVSVEENNNLIIDTNGSCRRKNGGSSLKMPTEEESRGIGNAETSSWKAVVLPRSIRIAKESQEDAQLKGAL
ncbi:hypothetical protein GQX74_014875 [Glossina fuscipes]|nr:hypothetical protein GQX74_014875 [Glossina fuscipes]